MCMHPLALLGYMHDIESMFIAGSYMLYSSPPTSLGAMNSLEPMDRPTSTTSSGLVHATSNSDSKIFSMSSILEQHVPKTAPCHVVVSSSTRTSPKPLPANTFSRQLKFGVDRILAINDCPPKRVCSPMSEMASMSSRPCSSCVVSRNCCGISCPFGPQIAPGLGPGIGHHPHHPQSHPYASTFPTTIVSPQPLIPFGPYAVYSPLTSEMHQHHHQQESKGHQQQGPTARTIIQHQQGGLLHHNHNQHHHHHHHHHHPTHPHHNHHQGNSPGKRKRSWSRAVFSNLQRKGLEKRFQIQKYITKPDRRQLAATLGLTDAQVKVWFQNRRMKWRHSKEAKEAFAQQQQEQQKSNKTDAVVKLSATIEDVSEEKDDAADSKVKKVENGPVITAISVEKLVSNN